MNLEYTLFSPGLITLYFFYRKITWIDKRVNCQQLFKISLVLKKFKKKDPFDTNFGDGIHPKELEIYSKKLDSGMILKKIITYMSQEKN